MSDVGPVHGMPSDFLDDLPDVNQDFIRLMWRLLKPVSQAGTCGWLAEEWVVRQMMEYWSPTLEPFRAFESAGVDGGWLCDAQRRKNKPEPTASFYERWSWATSEDNSENRYISFDVKFMKLVPVTGKNCWYEFTKPRKEEFRCDVFLLVFEGVSDRVAIVPREYYRHATNESYGRDPLTAKVPSWCVPFMVRFEHLDQAVQNLGRARNSGDYQNPSTLHTLHGWYPVGCRGDSFIPGASHGASLAGMLALMKEFEKAGYRVDFNPLQPLFCDFFLWLNGNDAEPVRIEYKLDTDWTSGARSPHRPRRQWHFMICGHIGPRPVLCIAKDEVYKLSERNDQGKERLANDDYLRLLRKDMTELLRYMKARVAGAIAKADAALHDSTSIEDLLSSGSDSVEDMNDNHAKSTSMIRVMDPVQSLTSWLSDYLNCRFAQTGKLICHALDARHPCQGITVAAHSWSPAEVDRHNVRGELPLSLDDPRLVVRKSTIIRVVNMSGGSCTYPLVADQRCLKLPTENQKQFFFMGATMDPRLHQLLGELQLTDGFAFIPSEVTILCSPNSKDWRASVPPIAEGPERESRAWRYKGEFEGDEDLPKLPHDGVLLQQDGSFQPDRKEQPLRYLTTLDRIVNDLTELLMVPDPEMSLGSPLSLRHRKTLLKSDYIETVGETMQRAWTFGLRKEKDKSLTKPWKQSQRWLKGSDGRQDQD